MIKILLVPRNPKHIYEKCKERHGKDIVDALQTLISERVAKGKGHLLAYQKTVSHITGHTVVFYVTYAEGTLPLLGNAKVLFSNKREVYIQVTVQTVLPSGAERRFHDAELSEIFDLGRKEKIRIEWKGWPPPALYFNNSKKRA